jgi:hypothetical protein
LVFLDGIAGDLLKGNALEEVRSALNALASKQGLPQSGIDRMRNDVAAARYRGADPSIIVVVRPDPKPKEQPHYFVRVYNWRPWESAALAQSMGSPGRAESGSKAGPSQTRDELLPKSGKSEIGTEVGRRLLAIPMAAPLVEFLVPGSMICEDFEAIEVDILGNRAAPRYVPLGICARVVVRSLDRWHPRFRKEQQARLDQWRQRWGGLTKGTAGTLPSYWWKNGIDGDRAAYGDLVLDREVGCVGLGFAPVKPDIAARVHGVLLAVGAPVALWARSPVEGDAERFLKDIVEAKKPSDLRDRVQEQRTKAVDSDGRSIGAALTLFWDDPEREPTPLKPPKRETNKDQGT